MIKVSTLLDLAENCYDPLGADYGFPFEPWCDAVPAGSEGPLFTDLGFAEYNPPVFYAGDVIYVLRSDDVWCALAAAADSGCDEYYEAVNNEWVLKGCF